MVVESNPETEAMSIQVPPLSFIWIAPPFAYIEPQPETVIEDTVIEDT